MDDDMDDHFDGTTDRPGSRGGPAEGGGGKDKKGAAGSVGDDDSGSAGARSGSRNFRNPRRGARRRKRINSFRVTLPGAEINGLLGATTSVCSARLLLSPHRDSSACAGGFWLATP